MTSTSKQQASSSCAGLQGNSKATGSASRSTVMLTSTPQGAHPPLTFVPAGGPPTPTDYEIMTESCDWCLAETPWDDGDLFGNNENLEETTQSTPPSNKQEPPQVNLQPRQALGIPMM
eukprot:scaffold2992_cov214-Amphora_coffeaeformis.AAC.36